MYGDRTGRQLNAEQYHNIKGDTMATNRKKRTRTPRQVMPEWAEILLKTGKKPGKNDADYDKFLGWLFFDEKIPGLKPSRELQKEINLFK
jgi:hypothetical protein